MRIKEMGYRDMKYGNDTENVLYVDIVSTRPNESGKGMVEFGFFLEEIWSLGKFDDLRELIDDQIKGEVVIEQSALMKDSSKISLSVSHGGLKFDYKLSDVADCIKSWHNFFS